MKTTRNIVLLICAVLAFGCDITTPDEDEWERISHTVDCIASWGYCDSDSGYAIGGDSNSSYEHPSFAYYILAGGVVFLETGHARTRISPSVELEVELLFEGSPIYKPSLRYYDPFGNVQFERVLDSATADYRIRINKSTYSRARQNKGEYALRANVEGFLSSIVVLGDSLAGEGRTRVVNFVLDKE